MDDQKKQNVLRAVLFTAIGAVIGAALDYTVRSDLARREHLREQRRDAYVEFLESDADWSDENRIPERYYSRTAKARRKIGIYGSKEVVKSLAAFWRSGGNKGRCGGNLRQHVLDVGIYQSMRRDVMGWRQTVTNQDLMLVLFDCEI